MLKQSRVPKGGLCRSSDLFSERRSLYFVRACMRPDFIPCVPEEGGEDEKDEEGL